MTEGDFDIYFGNYNDEANFDKVYFCSMGLRLFMSQEDFCRYAGHYGDISIKGMFNQLNRVAMWFNH